MQPIETWYNGTLFASLLEARWAVFFDAAGIPWEYEYLGDKLPWEIDDISQIPPLSELKIVPSQARWTQCPLCHHLQVGLYHHLRDVNNVIRREYLDCEYCCRFKPLIGETQKQEGYVTRCSEEYEVWTTRIGYILGSPQLMRGYTAARKFKAPRKRT